MTIEKENEKNSNTQNTQNDTNRKIFTELFRFEGCGSTTAFQSPPQKDSDTKEKVDPSKLIPGPGGIGF